MKVILVTSIMLILLCMSVHADIISINGGGDANLVITPGGPIEDFFTGLTPNSAAGGGGSGGGGGGRAGTSEFAITVIPQDTSVVQDNTLPIDITFTNNGLEENDVILRYYFQRTIPKMGGFITETSSEIVEIAKKLPVGDYKITRYMQVPGNMTDGNWSIVVEFKSKTRDLKAETGIEIVKSIWPVVQNFLIMIILFTVLTWYFLVYRKKQRNDNY